jgi:hypothetical protein
MEIPWITPAGIALFFKGLFSSVSSFFQALTGTTAPLFVIFGIPMRWFDIALVLILCGFMVGYLVLSDRIGAVEEKRQAAIDAGYLKPAKVEVKHSRWEKITVLIRSANPSDWKLAIIEADTMLDAFLTQLGYPGSSLGEKLKMCTKPNFPTVDDAWTAHKVRNQIAHNSEYALSQRQALYVYYLYERIFREGGFI